jgi:hypothetical protein
MVAAVITYDDLDYAEGNHTIASMSAIIGWRLGAKEEWFELDLTDEHYRELVRFLDAGRKVGEQRPQPLQDADGVPRYGSVLLWHAVGVSIRRYWKDYRAWAASHGYQVTTEGGNVSYVVWQVQEYENYLATLDRSRQQQAG